MPINLTAHEVRNILVLAAERLDASPRPTYQSKEDCIVDYLNMRDTGLIELRSDLARARVDLTAASRPRSKIANRKQELEALVQTLTVRRHELVAAGMRSKGFTTYMASSKDETQKLKTAYDEDRRLLANIRDILATKVLSDVTVECNDVRLILQALEENDLRSPEFGDVILFRPQPHLAYDFFSPFLATSSPLPAEIFGKAIGLLASPKDARAPQILEAGAVVARDRLVLPVEPSTGLPVYDADWDGLNDVLPAGARRYFFPILTDIIPLTSWGSTLANLFDRDTWDALRTKVIKASANACSVCGSSSSQMHCHEDWEYYEPVPPRREDSASFYGVQKLTGLKAVCPPCHEMFHPAFKDEAYVFGSEFRRLALMNRWKTEIIDEAQRFLVDRAIRRSSFSWALDLSILNAESLVVSDNWTLGEDGWLEFRESARTRIFGAVWRSTVGTMVYDPLPSIFYFQWPSIVQAEPAMQSAEDQPPE